MVDKSSERKITIQLVSAKLCNSVHSRTTTTMSDDKAHAPATSCAAIRPSIECEDNYSTHIRQLTHKLETLVEQRDTLQLEIAAQESRKSGALDKQKTYYEGLLRETEEHAARELREQETELKNLYSRIGIIRNDNQELNRQVGEYSENWDQCMSEKQSAIAVRDTALRQVKDLEARLQRAEEDFEGIDREMQEQTDRMERASEDATQLLADMRVEREIRQRMEDDIESLQEQLRGKEASITRLNEQIICLQDELRSAMETATPLISPLNTTFNPPEHVAKKRLRIKRRSAITAFSMSESGATSTAGNPAEDDASFETIINQPLRGETIPVGLSLSRRRKGQYMQSSASISSLCSLGTAASSTWGHQICTDPGGFSDESQDLSSMVTWPGSAGCSYSPAHESASNLQSWHRQLSLMSHEESPSPLMLTSGPEPIEPKDSSSEHRLSWTWLMQWLLKVALMVVMMAVTMAETRQYGEWKRANGTSRAMYVGAEAEQWLVGMTGGRAGWGVLSPSGVPERPSRWPLSVNPDRL